MHAPLVSWNNRAGSDAVGSIEEPGETVVKVVVSGSAGFIGARVVELLRDGGHSVEGLDASFGADIVTDDLELAFRGADAAVHLAGVLGTAELFDNPRRAVDVNVKGTLNVLDACRASGASYVGITMPAVWANVYQATKHCARELATAWHENYAVPVSHVRAFNAFGPRQKHYGVQKILPTFAVRAWRNQPIPVWGDGTQTVDLVYVDDLARMLIEAIGFGDDEVFDGGTGQALTVLQVAQIVLETTGSTGGIDFLPMRKGEKPTTIVAEGENWDLLSHHPELRLSDLERTIAWYRHIALAD